MATTVARSCLLDTNVLLAATIPARPLFAQATRIFEVWPEEGIELFTSGQILREYLAVATRAAELNGIGLEPGQAVANLEIFCQRLVILEEDRRVALRLQELVKALGIRGKQIHDANVVATAAVHGVSAVATANVADFSRFAEWITVLDLGAIPSS